MWRFWISILILVFFAFPSESQDTSYLKEISKKHRKTYDKALDQIDSGNPGKASQGLAELIDIYPGLVEAHILMGEIYIRESDYQKAELYLSKALELDSTFNKRMFLTLATVLRNQNKFKEATRYYRKFLSNCDGRPSFCDRVRNDMQICEFSAKAIKNRYNVNLKLLPEAINSDKSEYLMSFDIRNSHVIFTRRINGQEDLLYSQITDGVFSLPKPLEAINTRFNEGAHCLSSDGKILIFTACEYRDSYGGCDLYYSMFVNGGWSEAQNIGPHINTRFWEAQPSLSADGDQLYFSSNRTGGSGGKDIWVSELDNRGAWLPAKNLDGTINTSGNESSPFIHADNSTMYFRSDGHLGMGDYDIFKSSLNKDRTWGNVQNLGYPINSPGSDGALTVTLDGQTAYYAQEVFDESGKGHLDIFSFELPTEFRPKLVSYAQIKITDSNSGAAVKTKLLVIDHAQADTVYSGYSKEFGDLIIPLEIGTNYSLQVTHPEYIYHSEHISLDTVLGHSTPYIFAIELHKIPVDDTAAAQPVVLNNIFFEIGSAKLLPSSLIEIRALAGFMQQNPGIKLKIVGHTDEVGDSESNLKLSGERSKSVFDALVELGISPERLNYEGKGETQPIASNDTPEGRKMNRRTEFVIIEH